MSIPLVQENTKDAINTSIIAIKRNIERINSLLGLTSSEETDTSIFATKEELEALETALQPVDEVTVDNMHSVTSNAVAVAMKYCINSADRMSISSTTWTAIDDVYVNFIITNTSNVSNYNLKINDTDVCVFDSLLIAGTTYYIIHFSGIVKKGDVLTSNILNNSNNCRVFKLK